jgi:hypothetical protein
VGCEGARRGARRITVQVCSGPERRKRSWKKESIAGRATPVVTKSESFLTGTATARGEVFALAHWEHDADDLLCIVSPTMPPLAPSLHHRYGHLRLSLRS